MGTLNPILPVVKELMSKGCEVRYYFNKDTFQKEIEAAGATAERFDDYFLRWDELFEVSFRVFTCFHAFIGRGRVAGTERLQKLGGRQTGEHQVREQSH